MPVVAFFGDLADCLLGAGVLAMVALAISVRKLSLWFVDCSLVRSQIMLVR